MRTSPLLRSALGAILMSAGVVAAHAAEGVFYDPSNAASPTGKTIGYELYRTIGCPGRELLGVPCPVPLNLRRPLQRLSLLQHRWRQRRLLPQPLRRRR